MGCREDALLQQRDAKKARTQATTATRAQKALDVKVTARAGAIKLWHSDGDASKLSKDELFSLLHELGETKLKPTDGKIKVLLPLFDIVKDKQPQGRWEPMVKVLWDPPPEEIGSDGERVVQLALPAPQPAPNTIPALPLA